MRNLKKILALVLALMMVLSTMAVASATTFVDDADINAKYAEAVTVLSGLEVIKGIENTDGTFNFNPKGELTRAQAAVIIAKVRLGDLDTINDVVSVYTNPFTDVADWAVPYVLYAYSEGIISGRNATTYDPNATITGYELGKMLLVAADLLDPTTLMTTVYVVDGVEYANSTLATVAALNSGKNIEAKVVAKSDWQVTIAKALKENKIWNNEFVLSKKLTREEACYMAFNTMKAGEEGATMMDAFGADNTVLGNDKFGRPETNKWTANEGKAVLYVTYAAPVATVNGADFDHDSDANKKVYNFDVDAIYVNGSDTTELTLNDLEKPGYTIELYGKYNKTTQKYDITSVVAYAYEMMTIKDINATTKNITLTTVKGDITVKAPAKDAKASDLYALVSTYAKNDVLSVIAKPGYNTTDEATLTILEHAAAEFVNGTVTAIGSGYFRVNGVKQVKGALAANFDITAGATTGNFYLDPNGLVLGYGVVTPDTPEIAKQYIYVLATAAKAAGSTSNNDADGLFGSATSTASAAAAQAIVMNITTGEIEKVNLGIVYNATDKEYYYATEYGTASTTKVTTDDADLDEAGFYTYTVLADGSFVLIEKQTLTAVKVEEDKVTLNSTEKLYATSNTNYTRITIATAEGKSILVDTVKDVKVFERTGVANFPYGDYKYDGEALVLIDKDTGLATDIFVVDPVAEYAPASSAGYAIYAGEGETDKDGTKHGFYVDGEYVEYYVSADMTDAVKGTLYRLTYTAGVVTAKETSSFSKVATGKIVYIDDELGYVLVGDSTYTVKSSCVVVDSTDDYALTELTVGETYELYSYSNKVVYAILVEAE